MSLPFPALAGWAAFAFLVLVAAATGLTSDQSEGGRAAATATSACAPEWRIVRPTSGDATREDYSALAASSPTDVWAVGRNVEEGVAHPLIAHWDGSRWRTVLRLALFGTLNDVAVGARDDAWAVGVDHTTDETTFARFRNPLVLHWDGKEWQRVFLQPPRRAGELLDVEILGPRRIWVRGLGKDERIHEWNGTGWRALARPREFVDLGHFDLAVRTPTDAWATTGTATDARAAGPYVMHWDGRRWSRTAWPRRHALLEGIAPVSSGDAWIAGTVGLFDSPSRHTLIMRWNGRVWHTVPSPSPGRDSGLSAVDAVSADDVWAVGATGGRTLIEHWDGRRWRIIRSPSFVDALDFVDFDAVAHNDLWITGSGVAHYSC